MMTENEYLFAWFYYLLGAALLIACWWYLTRKIRWVEIRYLLRVVVGVAIVVPWYTNTQQDYLSPALLVAGLEAAFEGSEAFWRAGRPLVTAIAAAVTLSSVVFVGRWMYIRNRTV